MRYNINGRLIYDATDGTLILPGNNEADSQLSITANALLWFFLRHTAVVSRDEVLKKVWDDNGLTSSNSNLNQYLSMLRKTFRHYDIDNIIVTVSRGMLQLNQDLSINIVDAELAAVQATDDECNPERKPEAPVVAVQKIKPAIAPVSGGLCWSIAGICLLTLSALMLVFSFMASSELRPIRLTQMNNSRCELLASDDMLRSVSARTYGKNFDDVHRRLKLECKPEERFVFFYGDRLETNGLGRVFLAHCAKHEDNRFSYCDNYFYYSWKPQ